LSVGVLSLKADGIPNKNSFTKTTQAVTGEDIQAKHFPAGSGDPMYVVAKADKADQVKTTLAGVDGVAQVLPDVTVKDGQAFVLANLKDSPDSTAAGKTVERARKAVHAIPGAEAQVGGSSAIKLDMENAAARDSKVIIPVVLVVVFLIL